MEKPDKNEIEKQAKQILDKFAKALEKVEKEKSTEDEAYVDRPEFEREESKKESKKECEINKDFKQNMLNNAPKSDDDFIITEKGNWK